MEFLQWSVLKKNIFGGKSKYSMENYCSYFLNVSEVFQNIKLGTIQVLRHQRGGWVGSENGNF